MRGVRRLPGPSAAAIVCSLAGAAAPGAAIEVWREPFDNGCAALCPGDGYAGTNGAWRVVDLAPPGAFANAWYVSCAENGGPDGSCGHGCAGDASLHVGNVAGSPAAFLFCPTGDCGAAYDAFGPAVVADKRIESPLIDTTGHTGLTLRFQFLGEGVPCSDAADAELSTDGGATWTVLAACLRSSNAVCAPQGRWTAYAAPLPPAAGDNPRLRVGFRWRNDGDGFGTDPSFAVDDLVIESQAPGCDPAGIAPVAPVLAARSALDVRLVHPADPAADGYNTWFVAARELIPGARQGGAGTRPAGCDPAAAPGCVHPGAVDPGHGTILFYQVRGTCGGDEAGE